MTDFHLHSTFSPDGRSSMADMARAETERGIKHICFTDHVENCNASEPLGFEPGDFSEIRDAYFASIAETRELFRGEIEISAGIELGGINHDLETAAAITDNGDLDFVIGSVHNNRGKADFYFIPYESREECSELLRDYLLENIEIAKSGLCDVVAHIGYPLNCMLERGFALDLSEHTDIVRELVSELVERGVGMELNVSGFRRKINDSAPSMWILKLYRELGGEIITVGSDGHDVSQAGLFVDRGFSMLREAGFKYVTVFEKRKPRFIKI